MHALITNAFNEQTFGLVMSSTKPILIKMRLLLALMEQSFSVSCLPCLTASTGRPWNEKVYSLILHPISDSTKVVSEAMVYCCKKIWNGGVKLAMCIQNWHAHLWLRWRNNYCVLPSVHILDVQLKRCNHNQQDWRVIAKVSFNYCFVILQFHPTLSKYKYQVMDCNNYIYREQKSHWIPFSSRL